MAETFRAGFAGVTAEITCVYPATREFCKDYLTENPPDYRVSVTEKEIREEQVYFDEMNAREGVPTMVLADDYLETTAVLRWTANGMADYDGVMFHGSAIAVDGQGVIFTAKSGTGKSTHARLWQQLLGDRITIVNDDKPFLRFIGGVLYVCGNPWDGKHRLSTNTMVPLKGICLLERSEENFMEPMRPEDVYQQMLNQTNIPRATMSRLKVLSLVDRIAHSVELYRLGVNMDISAAQMAFHRLFSQENGQACPD